MASPRQPRTFKCRTDNKRARMAFLLFTSFYWDNNDFEKWDERYLVLCNATGIECDSEDIASRVDVEGLHELLDLILELGMWGSTPEGYQFWSKFYRDLQRLLAAEVDVAPQVDVEGLHKLFSKANNVAMMIRDGMSHRDAVDMCDAIAYHDLLKPAQKPRGLWHNGKRIRMADPRTLLLKVEE